MEAVAWHAGEDHTDEPECVSPVLVSFGSNLNDLLGHEQRQTLLLFVPLLAGTDGQMTEDQARGLMAADWLIRRCVPAWLDLAGWTEAAQGLSALPELTSWDQVRATQPALYDAGDWTWNNKEEFTSIVTSTTLPASIAAAHAIKEASPTSRKTMLTIDAATTAATRAILSVSGQGAYPVAYGLLDDLIKLFDRMIRV